ncbi:Histone-lysine N-methyltransferase [Actinidia chinensis var. chinensis]|uniref:Histone-lysine N-methyltransferase n=1 Tax=Actinidia chinensis var. chinensis TaxID=1590841 RepID=A0A2R6P2S7_ACTCC|nr:Histone-lysine N-methyltransferase [Actinidia chinensis var. chinensis]
MSSMAVAEIEGRGRALVASKPLKAGEILLRDSPILIYSALPLNPPPLPHQHHHHYCSNCFKSLPPSIPSAVSCPSCSLAHFCSPTCRSTALASSHTPWVCQSLRLLRSSPPLPHDRQVQARFLVAAYNLSAVSPSDFRTLLSLQGTEESPDAAARLLHSLVSSLPPPASEFGFSPELTAALLAKDKLNAFGLMEPFSEDGERSVRAYGIYPNASFFNHDCLPNACRFDYVDASDAGGFNTNIIVRAIHDVPHGREICLSYFPVNLNYSERQRRLKEDYGFTCACDRCKVEANWVEEEGEAMDEDDDEVMEDEEDVGIEEEENDFPHAYFFLRYMCERKNCWGTLAPLPPVNGAPSSVMECNVCGTLKNDEVTMDGDGDSLEG